MALRSFLQRSRTLSAFRRCASTTSTTPVQSIFPSSKVLTVPEGVNHQIQAMEYAVRGALVQRAERLAHQLRDPVAASKLPFSRIVYCNIGNPQSVGQSPITYVRQVLSAFVSPQLLNTAELPQDVVDRVRAYLDISHGAGAYTESPGIHEFRERVASAITRRDDVKSSPDDIFLTNGASEAVKTLMQLLVRDSNDGILIPIPQYPLYSATMKALGGVQVSYYLDEENGWGLDIDELKRSLDEARDSGVCVRAVVVINPGNPTGQVLSRDNIASIVSFCQENRLVILADEVYQTNVYVEDKPFVSFKRVVNDMGSDVELASFHSVSKGVMGECGMRGGYVELFNMGSEVRDLTYKVLSVSLCSNVLGQAAVDLMMNPPQTGEPSYDQYQEEVNNIFNSLKRKSIKLSKALNSFEGITCNRSEGAMYLFPRVEMPRKAELEAHSQNMASADVLYCFELLESTGICVVPGSGFGQRKGTHHFRTTFLPPEDQIDDVVEQMRRFHQGFLAKYS